MPYVRITVAWFNKTGQYLVKSGLDNDVCKPDRLIFTFDGQTDTADGRRDLVRTFDANLRDCGLNRSRIDNLDDLADLLTPSPAG